MPVVFVPRAVLSLLSWLILGLAGYLLWSWDAGYDVRNLDGELMRVRGPDWRLYLAIGMLAWSFLGRFVVLLLLPAAADEPQEARGRARIVSGDFGEALHTETFGAPDGPTLILTHGWGLNATAWWYNRRALAKHYRVVTWDLPGLGRSKAANDGKLTIDRLAANLGSIVESLGEGPFLLVGHSIGGMATQTFWRAAPPELRAKVSGLVLVNTTHLDPIQTMWLSPVWRALRWPLIEPMCRLTILLWPLAWLSAWQGYLSGSNQLAMRLTGFGRAATRGQVDLSARLAAKGSPAIQAKGNLAMFRWRATELLSQIDVPVLVISGGRDIVTQPHAGAEIEAAVPNGRLVCIEGAGHMGFMEQSKAYDDEIAQFAADCFASQTPEVVRRAAV